jgi:DNA-binding transcriptional regulator WhiA
MGLLEDLSDEKNFSKVKRAWCSVCELLKDLPLEDSKAFAIRLDNKAITHNSLAEVLKKNGYEISSSTLGRHRRKLCTGDSSR